MKERKLIIEQLDRKIVRFQNLDDLVIPTGGWIYSIRKALNMSLKQLGNRMAITPQSVREIEEREKKGSVSLKVLKQVGLALNMKFIYGFIPKQYTLEKMIEERATKLAKEIVYRTSASMTLEDQRPSDARLAKAVNEKTREIKSQIPKYLWD